MSSLRVQRLACLLGAFILVLLGVLACGLYAPTYCSRISVFSYKCPAHFCFSSLSQYLRIDLLSIQLIYFPYFYKRRGTGFSSVAFDYGPLTAFLLDLPGHHCFSTCAALLFRGEHYLKLSTVFILV